MSSDRFYNDLKSFSRFNDLAGDDYFEPVPEDWSVFVADIKDSTRAIEEGRYKDVNTIGAASIAVVRNVLKDDFPYAFGGDGATLLIPPGAMDEATKALTSLKALAQQAFGLELRIGRISVKEVSACGYAIELAKHELNAGMCVAAFRGGGLRFAEKSVKMDEIMYACPEAKPDPLALKGLSCRWKPIPSRRGRILAVLVMPKAENPSAVCEALLGFFDELFEGDLGNANPVNTELMEYKTMRDTIADERRYHSSRHSAGYFFRVLEIVASVLVFRHRAPPLFFRPEPYKRSMRIHADFRKYHDMLHMIIDCSEEQEEQIRQHLQACREKGELCYGIHASDASLMTCYVEGLNAGQHIHFIDGGNGGYTMAAKQLKRQLDKL